ncbi:MAG: lipopolysaccharide biosynthesis protein [Candidatus Bruticola sp.]
MLQRILHNKFINNVLITYITRFSGVLLGSLTIVLSSRALGPEGRGLMAYAFNIANLGCAFGCFGLNISNLVLGAKWIEYRSQLIGNSFSISFFSAVLLAIALFTAKAINPDLVPLNNIFLISAVIYTFFLLVYTSIQSLLYSFDMVKECNWQEFSSKLIIFILTLGLFGIGINSSYVFFAVFIIGIGASATWRLYSAFKFTGSLSLFSWPVFCLSASYNFKAFLFSALYSAIQMADLLIIQYYAGSEQSGYYNIVCSIRSLTLVFTLIVNQMLLPRLSANCRTIRDCLPMVWKINVIFLAFNLVLAILTAALAPQCINLLLGSNFAPCTVMLMWMLPGIIFFNSYNVMMAIFNVAGQPLNATIWLAGCTMLDLALCFYWRETGGLGAAQAFSCASFMLAVGSWLHSLIYKYTNSGNINLDSDNRKAP